MCVLRITITIIGALVCHKNTRNDVASARRGRGVIIVNRILPFAEIQLLGCRRRWLECAALAALLVLAATSAALSDSESIRLNIPAQPAYSALLDFARQAGVEISYSSEEVGNVRANAVIGNYSREAALRMLLAGTGLHAAFFSDRAITVRRASDPVLDTVGILAATSDSVRLAQAGGGRERQEPSRSSLDERSSNADVTEVERGREQRKLELERIEVTGSRILGPENASPVITITREEIDRAGYATVEDIFDDLPQNFGAGASLDVSTDFQNQRNVVGGRVDDRAGGISVNLRGLGASSTLILLNGRRLSPSGQTARFTNIALVPVTAIERVEILTDGASAIYGSDAIGGVVNFILRKDYEGAETRLRYGNARGDQPEKVVGQSIGKTWEAGNFLLSYEYYDSENLANDEREITSTNDLSRFGGTDWRVPGGHPANIEAGGQQWAIPAGQDGTSLTPADFDANTPLNFFNDREFGDVIPAVERHTAFLSFTQHVGPVELFGEGLFSTQEVRTRSSGGLGSFDVPNTNPFFVDPTGTGLTTVRVVGYSMTNGDWGPAITVGDIDSTTVSLGGRFAISKRWYGELSGSWAREEALNNNLLGRFDPALRTAALAQSDRDLAFNPFRGNGPSGTNQPLVESFLDRSQSFRSSSENELWSASLDVSGTAFTIPSGDVDIATGLEFREESLIGVDNTASVEVRADLNRDVIAAYTEIFVPLIAGPNSRPGLRRLELSLAARYEEYSDFGGSTNPKVGIVWSPTRALSLRGTWGTSFRAPALADLAVDLPGTNSARYLGQFFVDLGIIPFPYIVRSGGNEDLKAEEATTWTVGVDWKPELLKGFALDVTYYNVDFDNQIGPSGMTIVSGATDPRFSSLFNTNPTPEQIAAVVNDPRYEESAFGFTTPAADILSGAAPVGGILDGRIQNLSQSIVSGVDAQLSYDIDSPLGDFNVGLNANYMFDFERRLLAVDPLIDEVDTFGRPIDFRARARISWTSDAWSVSSFINYMDDYTDNVSDPVRQVDSWTTVDLTLSYEAGDEAGFLSNARAWLTVQNLADEEPPFIDTFGGLAYDSVNADPVGRFVTLQITKKW